MLHIHVTNRQPVQKVSHADGPIEFGRGPEEKHRRICLIDECVSRNQLRIEEDRSGVVTATNLSDKVDVEVAGDQLLEAGGQRRLLLPAKLLVGQTVIDITATTSSRSDELLQTISQPVRGTQNHVSLAGLGDTPDPSVLLRWFETLVEVQRAAVGSDAFYQQTARAVVDLVGLDCGMVILKDGDRWNIVAQYPDDGAARGYSHTVLREMCEERRTFFQSPDDGSATQSLVNVDAVVASPVLDVSGEQVLGAIYGARQVGLGPRISVSPLEAHVVQVLAAAVGAGLARQSMEAEANRQQILFGQFFSPVLVRELRRDPNLLQGKERDVTILFADIRNFSRLSERFGATKTVRLVSWVMDRITNQIREYAGVIVGYLGDGLLAMWNAPVDQPDHAELACRAAVSIQRDLRALEQDCVAEFGESISLGIGLNTGEAMVGNTGSQSRMHYGPLGHTVNLASRVESATKHLGIAILITETTRERLPEGFAIRRVCKAKLPGIDDSVDLYELGNDVESDQWQHLRVNYEEALELFEQGNWLAACKAAYSLLDASDKPTQMLISRALHYQAHPDQTDAVWVLQK